jgi:hypothetical protein
MKTKPDLAVLRGRNVIALITCLVTGKERVKGNLLGCSPDRKYIPYACIGRIYISGSESYEFCLHVDIWVLSITLKLL